MNKVKILHLLKTSKGATWALRLTKELSLLNFEIHVALPDGPLVQEYESNGIKTHLFNPELNISNPIKNFSTIKRLNKLIKELSPDIIHSHFVSTTLLLRIAQRNNKSIPRIFQVPGPLHLEHFLFRKLDLWTAKTNDYWLGTCKWTVNCYLSNNINPSKVGLTYYGVDESQFLDRSIYKPANIKAEHGIPLENKIVGMVSYFYAPKYYLGHKRGLKGHEDLIDAMCLVKEEIKNVTCVFIGRPWGNAAKYVEKVKKYAFEKDNKLFRFLGFVDYIPPYYYEFDVAVHPSHSENVGGAVESLYCKTPTVTTNIGGFPDVIIDGETGYLVPPKSPKALAMAIIKSLRNQEKSKRMSIAGLAHVRELLNVKGNASEVSHFYKQILAKKKVTN